LPLRGSRGGRLRLGGDRLSLLPEPARAAAGVLSATRDGMPPARRGLGQRRGPLGTWQWPGWLAWSSRMRRSCGRCCASLSTRPPHQESCPSVGAGPFAGSRMPSLHWVAS